MFSSLLVFCLSDFTVFFYLQRLSCTISLFDRSLSHIWLPNNLRIKKVEMKCTCLCVPVRIWMPCVQLHKYVLCFLGATNKALKKIQSTYLNNCSLTHTPCIHTCTSIHNTFWQRYTEHNMHTSPVLASPLLLHSREQMFGDSLQPQRISVYKANSSTQHF